MSGLRDQLNSIYEEAGKLTPQLVVDAARTKTHPLHDRFEWNDKIAGEKYRCVQAAMLIRSVKVEWVTGDDAPDDRVRAFHSVTRADGTAYEPIESIMADEVTTAIVLRQAEREWRAMHRRYKHLAEFLRIVKDDVA